MAKYETFEKAFSPLHASPDTLLEVQKKMHNENKTRRRFSKGAVIALAAVLTLSVAFAAAKIITATLHPATGAKDDVVAAFSDGSISTRKAVIYDSRGNHIDLPDMVRKNMDADTVARLVGDYLYDVEGTMTAGDYTLTMQSFLMDEQGTGILTCSLKNPNGISYADAGYGQITLPVSLNLCMNADKNDFMDAYVYLNETESTDNCLQLAVYFGCFKTYHVGDPVYVCMHEITENPVWQVMGIQPQSYAPVATFLSDGYRIVVSALGITVENPVADEIVIGELVLHYTDGTDYAVTSGKLNQMNSLVNYWQDDRTGFPAVCYVFNRVVDINAVASVSMEAQCYEGESADAVTIARTYEAA